LIIAYDLETTRIEAGTPSLLYITAFSSDMNLSMPVSSLTGLRDILEARFLLPENQGARFVGWNANNFDVYFIAQALLLSDQWLLQPYLTVGKALRGLKVKGKRKIKIDGRSRVLQFQFLDGISMTGMVGKTLKSFLATFAPELPKLDIGGFDDITFNPHDPKHVAYAVRDSEGLYVGLQKVAAIIGDLTEQDLKPTIGNLAVKYFMANVPSGTVLQKPSGLLLKILHGPVKRGGYCWCQRQYNGKVWKYDINQAYAAAMRDAALPCGEVTYTRRYSSTAPGIYECSLHYPASSPVPFYYKTGTCNEGRFTIGRKKITAWITSQEIEHLKKEGWHVNILRGFRWASSFNFADIVGRLETLRRTDPGGSGGPLGTMVKAIGNNAYGKTLEALNDVELILANECPPGYDVFEPFGDDAHIYSRVRKAFYKDYHLPQIGVFVTAHVRCLIRETALRNADAFLYADTDCVTFSEPVSLDIDKHRYGAWKIEAEGVPYIIIGKKIYRGADGTVKAKGLRTKELKERDFLEWEKKPPTQQQIQRQNFLKVLAGNDMFKNQERKGTDVRKSKIYEVKNGRFIPT